jgi:hypothetical protein
VPVLVEVAAPLVAVPLIAPPAVLALVLAAPPGPVLVPVGFGALTTLPHAASARVRKMVLLGIRPLYISFVAAVPPGRSRALEHGLAERQEGAGGVVVAGSAWLGLVP